MNNFNFVYNTQIIFGKDTHKSVGEEVKKYSSKILFHYGANSIKKSGLYDAVCASLKSAGVAYTELSGVQPNPRLTLVKEGIAICKKENINFILAVGGGSVIDSAKAIAMGAKYEGDVWDFFTKGARAKEVLKVATVLTIPAAGSESSPNCVISDDDTQNKIGCFNHMMRPVFSILNPELCFTLPKKQVAAGVADIMAHIMERYFTNTKNTEVSDALCEGVYKAVVHNAPKVLKTPEDYNAWAEIMWGGALAHNGLLGMGREEDWASHGMEHALSAVFDVTHGEGLSVMFPAWARYVCKENVNMFVQFARNMWGVESNLRDAESAALEGIDKMESFFKSLGLPVRLSELNIFEKDIALLASKAQTFGSKGNFKKLSKEDMEKIFKLAL